MVTVYVVARDNDSGGYDVESVHATLGGAMGYVGRPTERWDVLRDDLWVLGDYTIMQFELGA